jgi:hypothetical protein
MNNHKGDISDTLTKKKYFHQKKIITEKFITNRDVANLAKAVRDNEGCALYGKIKVNQVPGEFHISFHNYRNLWRDFNNQHRDLVSKVKLTHSIKSLSLGDTSEKIVKRFELDSNLFFRKFEDINTFNDDRLMNYNYFIKIIPYMLVDENWGTSYYAYSFSLSSKSSHYHPHYEDMPIVTPEYWVGFVLAFVQWYYNISYKEIISAYPCKELIKEYFPYHEMDIRKVLDLFNIRLNIVSKLKLKREEAKLSQSELSIISNVPIRTIKAYEQQSIDISKGQIDTIYKLSKALHCKMEDLI